MRSSLRVLWGIFSVLVVMGALPGVTATAPSAFTELSLPTAPDAWVVSLDNGTLPTVSVGELGVGLRLTFARPAKDDVITLTLKKPVPMPANARRMGIWVYTAGRFWGGDTNPMSFLVRDATGINYTYKAYGSAPVAGTWNYVECPRFRAGELGRLDEVLVHVEGGLQHHLPVAPLQFVGVTFSLGSANWIPAKETIELGRVCADGVVREKSSLYWQCSLGDRYLFGEMPFAQRPFITAGDILTAPGDYRVTWEARNAMYGRAVAQGEWMLPGYTANAAARFQRLDLPITAQGQYWVTLKMRNTRLSSAATPTTKDMVIKVVRGDEAQMPVLSADVRPLGSLLVLNPQRTQNIYAPGELQQCLIRVWRPLNQDANDFQLKTAQEAYPQGALGSEVTTPVHFAANDQYVDVPVQLALQNGRPLVTLTAKLMAGTQTLDSLTQRLGQREQAKVEPWTNRDKVLRYADIFENGNHLLCCAEWDARYLTSTDMAKFAEWVEDVKRQNVNTIELFPAWRDVEPMPGVFYWDQLDARVQVIAQHGMRVMINLDSTYPPAWVVEESQADEEGMVNGLWGGGSNNVLKSPSSRSLYESYGGYLTHMALRYRNNPALVAYSSLSIFFDHVWADHPWLGQYVDYSEAARTGFRSYLRDVRGFSLAALAARWHTKLSSWNDVELPRTDLFLGLATIDRPDPRPEWRDFLAFRQWSGESYFTQLLAGTVRQYDDLRPIGTHGAHADIKWYRANNMFLCAGSSEGSLDLNRKSRWPLPTRSESILMSFYTPYYTAMSMTNLLAQNNLHVQDFWKPEWRWDNSGDERRKTGTQSLAGWQALAQGELGKATPVHAAAGAKPILGLLDTRASILYGVRSFHWPRLDDYKMLADLACLMPHQLLQENATEEDLAALPCVVIDPTARIMPQAMMDRLVTYVKNGGKLVLPPTGGSFTEDPADGAQVLRRKLGLPMPTAKWTMAAEYRQPGKYNPHYPAGVTGKGTPGQQSLGEPNQTATAKTLGTIFPAGQQLVFRLGAYTMYNRDTWGDWSHMIPYFVYGRYREKAVAGGTTLATWSDGGPAATLHTIDKGQVMVLWGTPDWFNWRDALNDIAKWAAPTATTALTATPQPYAVTPDTAKGFLLVKDDIRWAVVRNEAQGWTSVYNASVAEQAKAPRTRQTITLRDLPAAKYRVRDITPLLTQGYDQVLTREQLAREGISAELIPSETRIFRLDPLP